MPSPKEWKDEKSAAGLVDAAAMIDLEERLMRSYIDARQWVGFMSSASDKGPQLQEALDAAAEEGLGATLILPPWAVVTAQTPEIDCSVIGHPGASAIKLGDNSNVDVLTTARYGAGGATGGVQGIELRGFEIDGNAAKQAEKGDVKLDGLAFALTDLYIHDLQGQLTSEMSRNDPGQNMEALVNNLRVMDCGGAMVWDGPHDSVLNNVIVRRAGEGACLEAYAISNWTNCHTYGNTDIGIVTSGGQFVNCQAEGTKEAKVRFIADGTLWVGGRIFSAGGEDGKVGFQFGDGEAATAYSTQIYGVEVANCDNGSFDFLTDGAGSVLSGFVYGSEAKPAITGEPDEDIDVWNLRVRSPMTLVEGENGLPKIFGALTLAVNGDIDSSGGRIKLTERASAPSASANAAKIYAVDNGAGKTKLMVIFGSGAAQQIAIQP